jgi:hypothetical protein
LTFLSAAVLASIGLPGYHEALATWYAVASQANSPYTCSEGERIMAGLSHADLAVQLSGMATWGILGSVFAGGIYMGIVLAMRDKRSQREAHA